MADVTVAFDGWNSSTHGWGEGSWGEGVSVPGAAGSIGSVTISADANVTVTGIAATGSVGAATVSADANVSVTGVSGTGSVGSVTVSANANAAVTGVAATGAVGSVTVTADSSTTVTGVAATGAVGSVTVSADAIVSVSGVAGTGAVGTVTVSANATVVPTGVAATGATLVRLQFQRSGDSCSDRRSTATGSIGSVTVDLSSKRCSRQQALQQRDADRDCYNKNRAMFSRLRVFQQQVQSVVLAVSGECRC